ncbi:MAG: RNA methyltransferase [Bacteroidales bacterium]
MEKKTILELDRIDVEQFKKIDKIPLVVILDDVRSLNNIGSIFRTSDAFLVEHIYLCGITATPPNNDIHKTALGAEDSVDWSYEKDTLSLVEKLKYDGYTVCAIEQVKGSISLTNFQINRSEKYAIILGNEVKGVNQSVVNACNQVIEIEQYGTKHSLNVSITAGILIYTFAQKLIK